MTQDENARRVLTIILDGWGINNEKDNNAIALAKTPNYDNYIKNYPNALLETSGESVGLPKGQMGTSEVNHMTIGAGRIIFQDLVRINKSIDNKSFEDNPAFLDAFEHVKNNNSILHIKGLLSPGGVHTHQKHFYALLEAAKKHDLKKVLVHIFTDGRDTLPQSALKYIEELENKMKEIGIGRIASISGRYYAMDRDHNWDRTEKAFDVLINKKSGSKYKSASEAVNTAYNSGITDEFIIPAHIEMDDQGEVGCISSDDAVIFINFRNDRPRQLTEKFLKNGPSNVKYVTMSTYHPDYQVRVAFPQKSIKHTLGEIVSKAGLKQLRVTETEKFAHLTFFMNCKHEEPFELEDRIMLDSNSDIKNYDEKPEMRTPDITTEILQAMEHQSHPVIFTNLCNGDMVGHTGNLKAAIKGIEVIDKSLKALVESAQKNHYDVIITADHGNAEKMYDPKEKQPISSHTTSMVPFILISEKHNSLNRMEGLLADIAPTILDLLSIEKPKAMTGISFLDKIRSPLRKSSILKNILHYFPFSKKNNK